MYESENQTGMNSDNLSGQDGMAADHSMDQPMGGDVQPGAEGMQAQPAQGQMQQPVYQAQPAQGQMQQPVYEAQPAQGQTQQPVYQAQPAQGQMQQPVYQAQPAQGQMQQPVYQAQPVQGQMQQPVYQAQPVQGQMQQPVYQAQPVQGQMQQPVYQAQPAQGQMQQPVYQAQPIQGQMQQPVYQAQPMQQPVVQAEEKTPKFDEHKYGKFMEIVGSLAKGQPPEMTDVMELMGDVDTQFWKGSMVGAATVFAMNNEAVKGLAATGIAKMMNMFGKTA